jgi:CDP-6-deoxy-D-xylo-4-hexulose-3-dehydrase
MNQVFWIGVYPGLTKEMLDFIAKVMTEFVVLAEAGLKTLV